MGHFAWDILGGDALYVADPVSGQIVGMEHARATIGDPAYRFDAGSPIISRGQRWCHLIHVDWDEAFVPFRYQDPRAARFTVLRLHTSEVQEFDTATPAVAQRKSGVLTEGEVQDPLLLESHYSRYTPAGLRLIRWKHLALSQKFAWWVQERLRVRVEQEKQQIDATFAVGGKRYLVEFKIGYHGDTKERFARLLVKSLSTTTTHQGPAMIIGC